jgi:guanosine-3',5'-bis(diphosphate) 3'-pyrophosphohydrolase
MMQTSIMARHFACGAHMAIGHKRKYTGECYTVHLKEVVEILWLAGYREENILSAAWLHDVVEDTAVTHFDIERYFGPQIAALVIGLTDVSRPEDGNRAVRKAIDRRALSMASPEVQTIKYADIISNTRSIVKHDPKFAEVYLKENQELLMVMNRGDARLYVAAQALVFDMDPIDAHPSDAELLNYGYAPGDYYGKCNQCGIQHMKAKHAFICKPCAAKNFIEVQVSLRRKEANYGR